MSLLFAFGSLGSGSLNMGLLAIFDPMYPVF